MPIRVPGVDGRPVSQNPVQAAPAPALNQGLAIVGAQLQNAGNTVRREGAQAMRVGQQFIDSANDARSSQQATLHGDALDKLVRDYQQSLAADAHDGYEPLNKEIKKLRDRFSGKLDNSQQAVLYKTKVDAQIRRARGTVDRHFAQQTRAWDIEQTEVTLNRYAQDYQEAALLGDEFDDERMARMTVARGVMEKLFDRLAEMSGMDPKTAAEQKKQRLARLHSRTLAVLSDQSAEQASDYLDTFGDEMDVATRTKAKAQVEAATLQDKALARMRKMMESAGPKATPAQRFQSVVEQAAKITDAGEFQAVMSMAGAEYARAQRVTNAQQNELVDEVEKIVYAEGGEFTTFYDLPATMQQRLRDEGLVDEVQAVIGQRDRVSQEMVVQQAIRNPGAFRGRDYQEFKRTHKPRLSKGDYATVESIFFSVNPEQAPPGTPVASILDASDLFNQEMDLSGKTKEALEGNPDLQRRAQNLRFAYQRLIESGGITKETPIDMKRKQIQALFRQDASVPGILGFGGEKVSIHEMAEGAEITVATRDGRVRQSRVGAVPPLVASELQVSMQRLFKNKRQPTEHEIQQAWFELDQPKSAKLARERWANQSFVMKGIVQSSLDREKPTDELMVDMDPSVRSRVDQLFASAGSTMQTFGGPRYLLGFLPPSLTTKQKDDARRYLDLLVSRQGRRR